MIPLLAKDAGVKEQDCNMNYRVKEMDVFQGFVSFTLVAYTPGI